MGFFMILLDATIVNIAVPSIMDSMSANVDDILWVLNGYTLVFVVLLITTSRIGDIIGQRRMFAAGMALFIIASAACGLAQTPFQLVAARVIQGVGGAMLSPQTLTILTSIFPANKRGAAFGVWGAVAGVAALAGPTLGGFIETNLSWHWIFFVNLPIGLMALIATFIFVPDLRVGKAHSLDVVGVVLATVALFAIVFGLIEGEPYQWGVVWNWLTIPEIIVAGLVLLAVFLYWERFPREPLVPFSIFRNRNYTAMNITSAIISFGTAGIFLPATIYLQAVLGMTALQAGLVMAPSSAVSIVVAPLAGRWTDKIGGKYILMFGLTLFAISVAIMTWISTPDTTWLDYVLPMALMGVAQGCTYSPMTTIAMRNISPAFAGAASGMLNTTRQLGMVIGSAAVGAVLQTQLAFHLYTEAQTRSAQLPPQMQASFVDGVTNAFKGGLFGASSQTAMPIPVGISPELGQQIQQIAHEVFIHGFIGAMVPSLLVSVVVLLVGALSCLLVNTKQHPSSFGLKESLAPEPVAIPADN
jgi:EmrB/QacA subfamily drug resistance transporter